MHSFGLLPSPPDPRDYVYVGPLSTTRALQTLPPTYDMRDKLTTVRDQGNQGTCVAQSGAAMKEYQERMQIAYKWYLSPQFIYNNRENYPEAGMWPRDLMAILLKYGIAQENDFPYGTQTKISSTVYEDAANFKIKAYAAIKLSGNGPVDIENIKNALYQNGPVVITFNVYNYTPKFWLSQPGETIIGGHAVTIVGWTTDSFIIRNSWGTGWGDRGYTYYSFSDYIRGVHMETWTAVDDLSHVVIPPPQPVCAGCGGTTGCIVM